MKTWISLIALTFATLSNYAEAAECETRAAEKKLAGAAKNSFVKHCQTMSKDAEKSANCESKAFDKNGKALTGAAKSSFVKSCMTKDTN